MNIQRKLIVTTVFIFSVFGVYSQVTIFAGASANNVSYKYGTGAELDDSYKMKLGYHAGILGELVLKGSRKEEFVVESGLLFDTKGSKQEFSTSEVTVENTTNLFYVDIPLLLKYRYKLRSRDKVYFGAGPFVGVGILGTQKGTEYLLGVEGSEYSHDVVWGSDDESDLKRFDYGATARLGLMMYNGLDISLSYDFGLANIAALDESIEINTRVMRLSLGYAFGQQKKRPYRR